MLCFPFYQLSRAFQAFFTVASLVAIVTLPTQQVQKSLGVLKYLSARFGVLPPGMVGRLLLVLDHASASSPANGARWKPWEKCFLLLEHLVVLMKQQVT